MIIYKAIRRMWLAVYNILSTIKTRAIFMCNQVDYGKIKTFGSPWVMVARGGHFIIGEHLTMNNNVNNNPIGCFQKCTFFVDRNAVLKIGNYVGISQTAIICHKSITIGDYVKIGGGVSIYDTDFHSLDPKIRRSSEDLFKRVERSVVIHDNVFIGAHSIILKGVEIGENSIVGAGSVVTKSIPANQIWGGSPAKFIKEFNA